MACLSGGGVRGPRCALDTARASAEGATRLVGPQWAAGGQRTLQLRHLVFFSYSWRCLRVVWPPAISQEPVAKTVDVGCCGVQCGSRPAPPSGLTPFTGRACASARPVKEKGHGQVIKLLSCRQSDQEFSPENQRQTLASAPSQPRTGRGFSWSCLLSYGVPWAKHPVDGGALRTTQKLNAHRAT